tara:strand:+ start:3124 stop:4140 length:1017 start_codon:yes stop_codon:yes gene_type:complete
MQDAARYGRNGDTMMAHLTPGETVVPEQVLQQNPQVARGLGRAFQDAGSDPRRYVVGSGQNSVNPMTGKREFFFDKILPFLTKAASNPAVQGAISNVALRKLQGKDVSLRDALLGGAIGGGIGAVSGRGTGIPFLDNMMSGADSDSNMMARIMGGSGSVDAAQTAGNNLARKQAMEAASGGVGRAEGLMGIGDFFGIDASDKGLGRMLNSKFGESIAMGLGSQLLDSLFSEDVDPDPYGNRARFERGAGEGPISLKERPVRERRVPVYRNEGGPAYYPRRNGGIMPSEGSGTKDDVPAMLTAGEFVMTRDAVKGAGNGSLQSGINEMYGMMNNLERKA